MTNIFIRETFKNDYTTRDAGEKLRHMILLSKKKIMLDFSDIKIASASFFDEGIAKLSLEGWDSKKLNDQLEFKNLFKLDQELLQQVCSARGLKLQKNK